MLITERRNKINIALIGTRGVPAGYGGFETCVEEIGKRLIKKGHDVTVYCRTSYYTKRLDNYLGMKLIYLPNLKSKSLDTMSHTCFSIINALFRNFDIYMIFNAANSPFTLPIRLMGKKIVINTDGVEWRRSKWGFYGKLYHRASELSACFFANRLVSDSKGITAYYKNKHNMYSTEIAYGAYVQRCNKETKLSKLGLKRSEYFLQITRFEPENNPLLTIQAYKRLNTDKKLVVVGGNPYHSEYTKQIERESGGRIILPGFIYDKELLKELWCFCYAYIHGNEAGGTNPALLQAMASGCYTMARDVIFNRDVLKDCGVYFDKDPKILAKRMEWTLDNPNDLQEFKEKARARILDNYSWDKVADKYERLFCEIVGGKYLWLSRRKEASE